MMLTEEDTFEAKPVDVCQWATPASKTAVAALARQLRSGARCIQELEDPKV